MNNISGRQIVSKDTHTYNGDDGEAGSKSITYDVPQNALVNNETDNLATNLMEKICSNTNLNLAVKRVKANKGSPGIDNMNIKELDDYLASHRQQLIESLLAGTYRPKSVKQVEIPKPDGGTRKLGIPTVVDRVIQQAILQILTPIYDPIFSEHSFGFRPKRNAHGAVLKAKEYVSKGYIFVVDIDLEKFFDNVNHDILMYRLTKEIKDKTLLRLIRKYLQAGIMINGITKDRYEGTPQGGPLSPLLSNIMLDELDKELEKRGHKFARYADDCNIYVKSQRAGERVYGSISKFLNKKLRLKVNQEKSKVATADKRQFLGYRILKDARLTLSPKAIAKFKDTIRKLAKRSQGKSLVMVISKLNQYLRGWRVYYKLIETPSTLKELIQWLRRKLRCYILQQKRHFKTIVKFLKSQGVSNKQARCIGSSGKGWWRLSKTQATHKAMSISWFKDQGLYDISMDVS